MKAVTIHDQKSDKTWTEVVDPDGPKWIDAARAALDISVSRGLIADAWQPHLQLSVRVATQQEIAQRIEEMRIATALKRSAASTSR